MTKQVPNNEIQYHIGLSKDMIEGAEYVLVPGDPGRVESLAKIFDPKPKHLATNREYTSYLANFHGQKVLVCSSGMGTPSTAIGVEELATIGLKYFLRIGTCGGIQPYTNLGDIIISSGAVRLDGTSRDYAPIEYPAVPSIPFTNDLIAAAEEVQVPYHVGITATTDTFWPGQERHDNYSGYLLRRFQGFMAEWRALNVLNFEMEVATLFVMCSAFKLHGACLCSVVAKRDESEKISVQAKDTTAKENWEKTARESIYISMQRRGLIKTK
jgi:uridine phosphorylase